MRTSAPLSLLKRTLRFLKPDLCLPFQPFIPLTFRKNHAAQVCLYNRMGKTILPPLDRNLYWQSEGFKKKKKKIKESNTHECSPISASKATAFPEPSDGALVPTEPRPEANAWTRHGRGRRERQRRRRKRRGKGFCDPRETVQSLRPHQPLRGEQVRGSVRIEQAAAGGLCLSQRKYLD